MKILGFKNYTEITNLSVDLIPHEEFHTGKWLKGEKWYYFFKTQRDFLIPSNEDFHKSLDVDIKSIIDLLHDWGIATTPSCSGHFYSSKTYSDIYKSLLNEAKLIRERGIILFDPETNTNFFYKDDSWELPWNEGDFLEKVINYQKRGVVGFVDGDNLIFNDFKNTENIHAIKDGILTLIIVVSDSKKSRKENWQNVFDIIKK